MMCSPALDKAVDLLPCLLGPAAGGAGPPAAPHDAGTPARHRPRRHLHLQRPVCHPGRGDLPTRGGRLLANQLGSAGTDAEGNRWAGSKAVS